MEGEMDFLTTARSLFAGTLCAGFACGVADAADLPVKAPPAPVFDQLDVHGIFDLTFANDYMTPRGLLVTRTGLTTQALLGLSLDIYKNPGGFISGISVDFGVWNDLWSEQNDPHVGSWNEFDWWVGANIKFAQAWTFGVHYWEFIPPAHDLPTSFPSTERNIEFALSYDDSWTNWPVTFHPYVKFWDHTSGPSNVVLGNRSDTFDVELGMVPTVDLKKYWGLPITLTAPTWVTVGPTDFWNRNDGTTNVCGLLSNQPCALSNAGVFATGLTGKTPLDFLIPKRLGNWYAKYGFQYYHIINDALLGAQEFTSAATGISTLNGTFPQAHRDVVVGFGGVGFTF
jgi:hypothetical protein